MRDANGRVSGFSPYSFGPTGPVNERNSIFQTASTPPVPLEGSYDPSLFPSPAGPFVESGSGDPSKSTPAMGAPGLFPKRARREERYVTQELVPGIRLQCDPDIEVGFVNVGTESAPVFVVTPGQRCGVLRENIETGQIVHDYAGFLPLLLLAAKPIAAAVTTHIAKHAAGETDVFDVAFANAKVVAGGKKLKVAGYDETGAVLLDSDGKRTFV